MALVEPATKLDPSGRIDWSIDDILIHLRLWAAESRYLLPEQRALKLGSGSGCDVRLHDTTGQLSREHAMMIPELGRWQIRDLGSKNGLWVEGARTSASTLHAGATIQLGGVILVAESLGFIGLRSLACRFMGWAPERQAAIDEALQNLRDGAIRRTPIILVGDDDLAPVALRFHRVILGPRLPFVVYDGGDVAAAIGAATPGTLCVRVRRHTSVSAIVDAVRGTEIAARPRLVLCASTVDEAATAVGTKPGRSAVIAVPSLATRGEELVRLVRELAQDIAAEMRAASSGFTMHDLERFQAIEFSGMADLEDSIRRVVAIRTWGVTAGAQRLGIKHSSLSQWARNKKRRLST
ncbi:MAG TPA: FHA domain-containing protein [Kofleriaceae bacterium]|jgi:hypothetical protein|nr:FHA domain-containing protein [Kofleriaceae bacterium]